MGDCNFCGQPAGFLRHQHKECLQRHDDGTRKLLSLMSLGSTVPATTLVEQINEIADHSFIDEAERRKLEVQGWSNAVEGALSNNILDEASEKQLAEWKDKFSFSQVELESNESYTHLTKSVVIRELLNGVIPKHFAFKEAPAFNLQKGELVVWGFFPVGYFEERVHRAYVGRSQGVSIRVMKGVYYRTGAFQGHAVTSKDTVLADTGVMAVTNKHIYFSGPSKSFRVPYRKIVSFSPHSDGIGIFRDAVSAKPQIFVNGDGWFTYNLVVNLAHLDAQQN